MSQTKFTPSEEQLHNVVNHNKTRAEEYLHDPDKSRQLLEEAVKKANTNQDSHSGQSDFWAQLKAFFRLLKAYTQKEYTVVPWGSIVLVIVAILYFISPIDLIIDWLPLAGFLDDAAVMVFVIRQIKHDLDSFLVWEAANKYPAGQIIDL